MTIPRYVHVGADGIRQVENIVKFISESYVPPTAHGHSRSSLRKRMPYSLSEIACWQHMQFGVVPDVEVWVRRGVEAALHYFLDDWWVGDANSARTIDKRHPKRWLNWYTPYSRGLLLCLLQQDFSAAGKLSDWLEADIMPEYAGMGGDLEVEFAQLYLLFGNELRSTPMPGIDAVAEKIRKCRTKRPRLIMKAWDALLARNQSEFDVAFRKSVEHHAASPKLEAGNARLGDRLALPQSIISMIARHRGMTVPQLPEELEAYVISRATIGLE